MIEYHPLDRKKINAYLIAGVTILAMLCVGLWMSGCATHKLHDPFRNADGTVNVSAILGAVDFGLQADCQIPGAVTQDICSYGTASLKAASAIQAKDPASLKVAVVAILTKAETDKPAITPYVSWAVALLS